MLKWLFNRLSRPKQKQFCIWALDRLLQSKDSSIDQKTAITLIEKITASNGNKVTAFMMRDKDDN